MHASLTLVPCLIFSTQYLLINLGLSKNFGDVDFEHLTFPTTMRVDWVRVYQPKDKINIGCDPTDFPTQAYINQ
jgi:beta-glucanase (GH16 family)